MGRATRDTPSYRDDPDAVSMHTTPDDYSYDDAPEIAGLPPAYADNEVATSTQPVEAVLPIEKRRDHNNEVSMSKNGPQALETNEFLDGRYDTDPVYLEDSIRGFATRPPNQLVYIMGTHRETVQKGDKKETKTVTDFRLVLNISALLNQNMMELRTVENGEKALRGSFMKKRAPGFKQDLEVGNPKPGLKEWCHLYCASPSKLRIFRLQRVVTGLDETYIKNQIDGLIRSTNYRGHISVTFPIENRNVDLYTSNRINQWRLKKWICWIFYLTFFWIFTWPYLFFATKRYAVVQAVWPFSRTEASGERVFGRISESQWYQKWHVGIRRLVLDKFEGEVSYEQLDGVQQRPADPPMPGTINTGHAGVDNAVGLLTQGFQVASALRNGGNLGRGLQGGWGYDT